MSYVYVCIPQGNFSGWTRTIGKHCLMTQGRAESSWWAGFGEQFLWVSFHSVFLVSFIPTFDLFQSRGEMLWIAQIWTLRREAGHGPWSSCFSFHAQGLEVRIIVFSLCLQSHPYTAFIENWRRMQISNFKICIYLFICMLELVWG